MLALIQVRVFLVEMKLSSTVSCEVFATLLGNLDKLLLFKIHRSTGVPIKDVYEMNSLGLGHSYISIKGGFTSVYPALPCLVRTSLIYLKDFDGKSQEVLHLFIEPSLTDVLGHAICLFSLDLLTSLPEATLITSLK